MSQSIDDHRDDGRRQSSAYDNKKQFHEGTVTSVTPWATPAKDGLRISAEMATDCSYSVGISAYLPFLQGCTMMGASEKEDAPWMNSATRSQVHQAAAGSGFWQQQSLFCWFCSTRFLRAALARPSIRQPSTQPIKAHLCLKKLHQPNPLLRQWESNQNTTHHSNAKGERNIAFAFAVFAPKSKIEACPC